MSQSRAEAILVPRLAGPAATWWRNAMNAIRTEPISRDSFFALWSGAGRRLGRAPVEVSREEEEKLPFSPRGWGTDEFARALLLLAAFEASPANEHMPLVEELYGTGEIRERQALLKVLAHLPAPSRFVSVGIEAVRSNATSVIEAIACDNPYPADHFPDDAFAQMVLKCLFCGLPLRRVQGLSRRMTSELKRMVAAYASERVAAGRNVPDDAALVLDGDANAPV